MKRPNLVFLIADDHRFDGIGAYGNPDVRTPVLDRLAAQGALFQSMYIMGGQTAALCVPSRACLLTGVQPFRATGSGMRSIGLAETENRELWNLDPALPTFPETLRESGYRTCGIGKWHNGKASFARSFTDGAAIFFGGMGDHVGLPVHGYDSTGEYSDEAAEVSETYSTELFADAAVDWIRSYQGEEPYLLYVAFTAPHDPRTPPPAYAAMYRADNLPLPSNYAERHPFDNGELDVRDELLAPLPRTPESIRAELADYYGMISHLDAQIGRIVEAIAERDGGGGGEGNDGGIGAGEAVAEREGEGGEGDGGAGVGEAGAGADDGASGAGEAVSACADSGDDAGAGRETFVVYTADHGLALGQHGLLGKQNLYEHSIHTPLVVAGPGLPRGAVVEELACQLDIMPTVCELAGVPLPKTAEGRSLVPLMRSEAGYGGREYVFAAYKDLQRMASDGRWKLIRYFRSAASGSGTDTVQLFDLHRDPWETINLVSAPERQAERARLEQALRGWQLHIGDPLVKAALAAE
ncbi:sulfatase-like hydrolase/transferase [Paenibacillus koleovorans]|uniref:sulfatase-like hydrolase/transferase n=1 Tax=Paenibacillus koleovorans TaxID=121608 RepID=UPI000FD7B33B|nr:sulfatase-like hydrolase/transferase [Paenibacillus koleovorans]